MLSKDQNQNVGDGATAYQASGNLSVVNVGITYSEARQIALDVAQTTFHELSGAARELAGSRVEEITDQVIAKLANDYPEGLQKAKDPDFQYALYSVQKEYARNGDEDLGELLVDLLVDLSKQDQRNILQIVLNESLTTAPKLTESYLATLSVLFLLKYTQNHGIGNHDALGDYLDKHVLPFVSKIAKSQASYQHMEFTGCGSVGVMGHTLEATLGTTYQGQFMKGFDLDEISRRNISVGFNPHFFILCLNDRSKFQVNANSREQLEKKFDAVPITPDDKAQIISLFDLGKMGDDEIRAKVVEIRPYMAQVFETWNNSLLKSFTLTSVGIAIGHANLKRLIGEFASLEIWIN